MFCVYPAYFEKLLERGYRMNKWENQLQVHESLVREIKENQQKGKGELRFDNHIVIASDIAARATSLARAAS